MKMNGIDVNDVKSFYYDGDIDNFEYIEKKMREEKIDPDKVDILNIVAAIMDYGECEKDESSHGWETITLKYNYLIHYKEK